jgi:hypothetical protein
MVRSNQSPKVALERLADLVSEHVLCLQAEGGWEIHVCSDMTMDPLRKTRTIEALAFLADIARMKKMDRDEIDRQVQWTGKIPSQGLPSWMESALCWLRYGTRSVPGKAEARIPTRKAYKE